MTDAVAASVLDEKCQNFDSFAVGDGVFSVINNQWSTTAVEQCIQRHDDGSYGWTWNRGSTDATGPNYPQVLLGTKPWGSDTGTPLFPVQRGNVDQFEMELAVDRTTSGTEWNFTEEWWLTSNKPDGDVSNSITHEVMLVLDWGDNHGHGSAIESDAVTDKYGNTIDYWANYQIGWDFHIFRIAAQQVPDTVDLSAIMAYMSQNIDSVTPDLWISGVELGNEYWDDTSGSTRINQFDVTLNGEREASGPGSGQDTTAPTVPTNFGSPSQTSSTVDLAWDSSADSGGSGLSHYEVFVDGTRSQQVSAGTTQTTVGELSADTGYEFGVSAVDNAGNSSALASLTQRTQAEAVEQQPFDGPNPIPGRLQAENFDTGGEGVAYHDTTSGNSGVGYRDTDVDIGGSSTEGYNIGWIESGEWWEYTVEVDQADTYDLTARVASAMAGGAFHVDIDGQTVTDSIAVPETGGWADWTTVSETGIALSSGQHVVRVVADADTWNLDWIDFRTSADTDGTPTVSWNTPSDGETVSGTITGQIDATDSEDGDDSLDVTYTVDGGSSLTATYDSTSGYYEDAWDTTGVSDGSHTLEATATDSAGNTSSSSISITTDNTGSLPTVDTLSLSEVETGDSDAEFDADWSVSDTDGNLTSVALVLLQDSDGSTEDSTTVDVSGSSDSGTTRLVAAGDDGSANSYTVDATVTDSDGNTGSDSTSVSEIENANSAPSARIDSLKNRSNPAWNRFTVDWSAGDSDGNLDTVAVKLLDSSGRVLDSASNGVSGSSASATDEIRSKQNGVTVVVTATDTDGSSGSDSQSV